MKKYLLGLLAIVLAVGFSSFKAKHTVATFLVYQDNQTTSTGCYYPTVFTNCGSVPTGHTYYYNNGGWIAISAGTTLYTQE